MTKIANSFLSLTEIVLKHAGQPLTTVEIWKYAEKHDLMGDLRTKGKTPWASIGAQVYTDLIAHGDKSIFIQTSKRPARFAMRDTWKGQLRQKAGQLKNQLEAINFDDPEIKNFHERDLHPILVCYARSHTHFKAHLKTIMHEKSSNKKSGLNEWLHPDLVGVYFPFGDYDPSTLDIQRLLLVQSLKFFSFEMKKELTLGSLRQAYFQAVSNSSWAHQGYLVSLKVSDEPEFMDELRRLNNAFGIGLIKLNAENVHDSEIVLPSRINQDMDWDTVDRLTSENPDFKIFLKEVGEDITLKKVKSKYDEVLSEEKMDRFVRDKGIL
jgi:hypothetical protein